MSQIVEFFSNQTVFLTGGSGFLGKILIEKLLRQCQDLKTIYVLIRPKKGKTAEQRLEELFAYACFDRLKATNLESLKKVRLVSGDCREPFLGLSDENIEILRNETTCVIHAAANVKFDQSLKEAAHNARSTRDVLQLAKKMPNLKVFVHVSTAYSNCVYSHIKEEFYEPPIQAETLFTMVDNLDDEVLQRITPNLLGQWPNTYVYTKSVAEDVVRNVGKDLPVAIVRPAIVCSAIKEPIPGWIDNFYGVVGIVMGAALGVIRSLNVKKDSPAFLVPVDFVSNCILAAAWRREKSDTTIIYNYTGQKKQPITWEKFMAKVEAQCWTAFSDKVIWYYGLTLRENRRWHKICVFLMHTLPAHVIDFGRRCLGMPALAVDNYRRLNKLLDLISYFSTRTWSFDYGNVDRLWGNMTDEDKKLFDFDLEGCDEDAYTRDAVFGGRLYLLKDTPDTIPRGKRKVRMLFVAHYTFLTLIFYLLYKLISFVFSLF